MRDDDGNRYLGDGWFSWEKDPASYTQHAPPEPLDERGDGDVPDLTDPATLGCLLALVREAWGAPDAHVRPTVRGRWHVFSAAAGGHLSGPSATEAEALVAALEAAPAKETTQ